MNSVIDDVLQPGRRITVAEYYRMAEIGLLAPDARVELIEGAIVDMAPIGSRHGAKTSYLDRVLSRAAGDTAIVRVQLPISLDSMSEPQPDLALVKPRPDFYDKHHPVAADTLLIIEVCQTSLRYDHRVKVPLYASHGIPEVWLLDLQGGRLHCFRSAAPGRIRAGVRDRASRRDVFSGTAGSVCGFVWTGLNELELWYPDIRGQVLRSR